MSSLKDLKAFAIGELDESALSTDSSNIDDILADKEFMTECTTLAMPLILQSEVMGESARALEEAAEGAYIQLENYLIGQGMINEASAPSTIKNSKINIMHLNKQAQLNRLKKIMVLKLARRANSNKYKKYKIGQKIKKENMADMIKTYGNKAEKLAKTIWKNSQKHGKVNAVVSKQKTAAKKK